MNDAFRQRGAREVDNDCGDDDEDDHDGVGEKREGQKATTTVQAPL